MFNPETRVAELCHQHNPAPLTVCARKEGSPEGAVRLKAPMQAAAAAAAAGRYPTQGDHSGGAVARAALKNAAGGQRLGAAGMYVTWSDPTVPSGCAGYPKRRGNTSRGRGTLPPPRY